MNSEHHSTDQSNSNDIVDKTRRGLTIAGIASPVLFSLTSSTVWGTTKSGGGCNWSGKLSGNVSHQTKSSSTCNNSYPFGLGPKGWNGCGSMPAPCSLSTNFNQFFSVQVCIKTGTTSSSPNWPSSTGSRNPTQYYIYNPSFDDILQLENNPSHVVVDYHKNSSTCANAPYAVAGCLNALDASVASPLTCDQIVSAYQSSPASLSSPLGSWLQQLDSSAYPSIALAKSTWGV